MLHHKKVITTLRIRTFILLFPAILSGCGSSYMAPDGPPLGGVGGNLPAPTSMTGNWEIIFHSQDSPEHYFALEANLTQTGMHVFAGKPSALLFQAKSAASLNGIVMTRLGGQCDSSKAGDVVLDATISNVGTTSEAVTFTIAQEGDLGTATFTATATSNGQAVSNGTYTIPASCSLPADRGTFLGFRDSVQFSGESYSGTLNGGTDVIVVGITSANGFDLTVNGTDNGTLFSATGSVVGFSADLDGVISGNNFHWFVLYDSTYNNFRVFDANDKLIGSFQPAN